MSEPAPPARPRWAESHPRLTRYYDEEWGIPVWDERGLFERLSLEVFQAGLSWLTVLQKRDAFRSAFADFEPGRVAAFSSRDVERLLSDAAIIRNRRKIEATIHNARATMALRDAGESLAALVWSAMPERSPCVRTDAELPVSSPESAALAAALQQRGFSRVGPITMFALMTAIGVVDGHLAGSHRRGSSGLWQADGTRSALAIPSHLRKTPATATS